MPAAQHRKLLAGIGIALALAWGAPATFVQAEVSVKGSPHDFGTGAPLVAPAGSCSACHIPHKAKDTVRLWPRWLGEVNTPSPRNYRYELRDYDGLNLAGQPSSTEKNYLGPVTVLCYDCHDKHDTNTVSADDAPILSNFAVSHKPQDIMSGYTVSSPGSGVMTEDSWGASGGRPGYYETNPPGTTTYGVNPGAPLSQTGGHFFKQDPTKSANDEYKAGDKLPCRDCHDPHAWESSGTWQAFFRRKWPTDTIPARVGLLGGNPEAIASQEMANPVIGPRPRSSPSSRKLCIACHGTGDASRTPDMWAVQFQDIRTEYDRDVGTSDNITQAPGGVAEHLSSSTVACVTCHNHNAVSVSCTSCHGYPPSDTALVKYPSTFIPVPDPDADGDSRTTDSHPRHAGNKSGQAPNSYAVYSFGCDVCHYGSAGVGVATLDQHQNNLVSVVLQGIYTRNGGTYDNTNYYNRDATFPPAFTGQLDNSGQPTTRGWGNGSRFGGNSCRNVYCHSAGRDQSSMAQDCTVLYPRPTWNSGPLHCNDCHGYLTDNVANGGINWGMPGYPNGGGGTTSANSHASHVVGAGIECSVCHSQTVGGTGAGRFILSTVPSRHVDGVRDVRFDGVNATGIYDNALGSKRCDVTCHGRGQAPAQQPQWGGTLTGGCFSCHAGAEQPYKPQFDYGTAGTPNPVDNAEYLHSGHGRTGSNYPGDNNLPAGFGNYTIAPVDCYLCHSQNASHTTKDSNDPFRLGFGADAAGQSGTLKGAFADNTDLLCLGCHGDAAQRSGHDRAAQGATTVNAQTHARGITGTKYNWPGPNYPWKCVDCHDPHGDGKSGAERYMMLRSGINAPVDNNDAGVGSDGKSVTRRTDANVRSVTFSSLAGYAAGSFAQPGNGTGGTWGPCEVCHTQTSAYSRTLDNTSSHATRTNRCTTCHPHAKGFAASACEGCHGGLDGLQAPSGNAPVVTRYWQGSGHGKFTTGLPARGIVCEDCHDTGYLTGSSHRTDGSVAGTPPLNINTQAWPGKPAPTADTSPNANTSHLRAGFINTAAATRADVARTFDNFCAAAAGCHARDYHRHQKNSGPAPTDVMRFGDPGTGTTSNPKQYNWLPLATYGTDFYRSQSPWVDSDMRLSGLADNTNYGLCVSCHDPHGTATTDLKGSGAAATNAMVRWNWKTDAGTFCARACHTSRPPP